MKHRLLTDIYRLRRKSPAKTSWRFGVAALRRWSAAITSFILIVARPKQQTYYGGKFLLATEGDTFERTLSAFRATPAGHDLLKRRPDSWVLLRDHAMLRACPPASLGSWYLEFMRTHGLDEQHYLDIAIEAGARFTGDAERVWFRTRVDASHDMRHVLSGYGPDVLGEICLLSFRFGQTKHRGALLLALLGLFKLTFTGHRAVLGSVVEAYRRGCQARLLDLLTWEDGFIQPLSAHRATLGLMPCKLYPSPFAPEAYANLARSLHQKTNARHQTAGATCDAP